MIKIILRTIDFMRFEVLQLRLLMTALRGLEEVTDKVRDVLLIIVKAMQYLFSKREFCRFQFKR